MTKVMKLLLKTVEDVKEFCRQVGRLKYGAKVHGSGGYIVNGASLMGLYSLDLSLPIKVEFDEENRYEDLELFKRWEVK